MNEASPDNYAADDGGLSGENADPGRQWIIPEPTGERATLRRFVHWKSGIFLPTRTLPA